MESTSNNKMCAWCRVDKNLLDFWVKDGRIGGICQACHSTHIQPKLLSSEEKKKRVRASHKIQRKRLIQRKREYVKSYLTGKVCMDCSEADTVVLQFDHRDPSLKEFNISEAINGCHGIARLQKEIDKCDVVCANCHTRRSAKMFGYWKCQEV